MFGRSVIKKMVITVVVGAVVWFVVSAPTIRAFYTSGMAGLNTSTTTVRFGWFWDDDYPDEDEDQNVDDDTPEEDDSTPAAYAPAILGDMDDSSDNAGHDGPSEDDNNPGPYAPDEASDPMDDSDDSNDDNDNADHPELGDNGDATANGPNAAGNHGSNRGAKRRYLSNEANEYTAGHDYDEEEDDSPHSRYRFYRRLVERYGQQGQTDRRVQSSAQQGRLYELIEQKCGNTQGKERSACIRELRSELVEHALNNAIKQIDRATQLVRGSRSLDFIEKQRLLLKLRKVKRALNKARAESDWEGAKKELRNAQKILAEVREKFEAQLYKRLVVKVSRIEQAILKVAKNQDLTDAQKQALLEIADRLSKARQVLVQKGTSWEDKIQAVTDIAIAVKDLRKVVEDIKNSR